MVPGDSVVNGAPFACVPPHIHMRERVASKQAVASIREGGKTGVKTATHSAVGTSVIMRVSAFVAAPRRPPKVKSRRAATSKTTGA
jgi:hypothetical protein